LSLTDASLLISRLPGILSWRKKRLRKQGYAAYMSIRAIEIAGVLATFTYFSLGLFLFANTVDQMKRIFEIVR